MKVRLSILKEYLDCILVEGRVDDAREKFPEMEDDTFDQIVANQPTGSNNKYLMWSCKQVDEGYSIEVVVQAVRLFDGNQQRLKQRDINQYKEPGEIESAVGELGKSKGQQKAEVRADTDTIYQDDKFLVLRPHTAEASCKYGTGTRWCIAATNSHNYFSSYSTSNNKFYFIIDKTLDASNPASKFAIAYISSGNVQVYNAPDKLVKLDVVAQHVGEKWPVIWQKIESHVKANPLTREVEEAQRATEDLIKSLLKGDNISDKSIVKIAKEGKLTDQVVNAVIDRFKHITGPAQGYNDPRAEVSSALSSRAEELSPNSSMKVIKFLSSQRTPNNGYWSGQWYLEKLLEKSPLEPEQLRELSNTEDELILTSLLGNPNTPPDLFDMLTGKVKEFQSREKKSAAYWHIMQSGKMTMAQFQEAITQAPEAVQTMLSYPEKAKITIEMLMMITPKSEWEVKKLLSFPNITPEASANIIEKGWKLLNARTLFDILRSTDLATDKIEELWRGKVQSTRTALLQNPSIGAKTASKFAKSNNSAYRFAIAHNPITPEEDLDLLAKDESVSTRSAVAANPKTGHATLTTLASDEGTAVRASVAGNLATPRNVLHAMKKDSDEFVRKVARKTLKSLETTESIIRGMSSMRYILKEEMEDDNMQDIMTPDWQQLPSGSTTTRNFIAIFLLQNNGAATREEINNAWNRWPAKNSRGPRGWGRRLRQGRYAENDTVWKALAREENHDSNGSVRTITAAGKGWFWSPPGINVGSIVRLTPVGASMAMNSLKKIQSEYNADGRYRMKGDPANDSQWRTRTATPVAKSAPSKELAPNRTNEPTSATATSVPRGPKTTYKIYGKFKGHSASTRLKGQAYVAPADTQFKSGDQAVLSPGEDGKLKVKKPDGDHTQDLDPIDG